MDRPAISTRSPDDAQSSSHTDTRTQTDTSSFELPYSHYNRGRIVLPGWKFMKGSIFDEVWWAKMKEDVWNYTYSRDMLSGIVVTGKHEDVVREIDRFWREAGMDAYKQLQWRDIYVEDAVIEEIASEFSKLRITHRNYRGKFEFFPRLPIELRLQIWHYALPGPRVVELARNLGGNESWVCPRSNAPLASGLLGANRESRDFILSYYQQLYRPLSSKKGCEDDFYDSGLGRGYYRSQFDILYIGGRTHFGGSLQRKDFSGDSPYFTRLHGNSLIIRMAFRELHALACSFEEFSNLTNQFRDCSKPTAMHFAKNFAMVFPKLEVMIVIIGDRIWGATNSHRSRESPIGKIEIAKVTKQLLKSDIYCHQKADVEYLVDQLSLPFAVKIKTVTRDGQFSPPDDGT